MTHLDTVGYEGGMVLMLWENFFKPEIRASGDGLVVQEKVRISQPSDIEINAFVRASSGFRVNLKMRSISSDTLFVDCNCTLGKKNSFCKHIWAALRATQDKPDFFEHKSKLSFSKEEPAISQYESKKIDLKARQKKYQKELYQAQKLRQKEYRKSKEKIPEKVKVPENVSRAFAFFQENGFELNEKFNSEAVLTARRKLARVFHPDKGGTHEEITELNRHSDVLLKFLKR